VNGPQSSARQGNAKRNLFLASFLFLFLELALIRWLPAQVLFLTFFTNTVLLGSFLGLALGCLAARRGDWLRVTPALLVALIAAAALMEWIRLALQDILNLGNNATSPQVVFFGSEIRVGDASAFVVPIEFVAGFFFLLVALTMIGIGQVIGRQFAALTDAVGAYVANISGSLAGILAFSVVSWWLPPVWWFAIACAGLIYFLLADSRRRWWSISLAILAPVVLMTPQWFGLGAIRERFPNESWSPYYRINYVPTTRVIVANLIGQQTMISKNDPYAGYGLPYMMNRDAGLPPFREILIIGAGSGNDVSRALEWAAPDAHIDAVEIDPVIQSLGRRDHPDHPYQDPRVTGHLGDGRNFLRSTNKKYDLILFALVDSLVLHSGVSNLRLESYLFTRESIEDVKRCLKPDGLFVMYNYFRQGWIVARLAKTSGGVFQRPPVVLTLPYRDRVAADAKADAFTMLMNGARAEKIGEAFKARGGYSLSSKEAPSPSSPDGFDLKAGTGLLTLSPAAVEIPEDLREAEDAWPFLYLRNPMIPTLSWRGIGIIAFVSAIMLWLFARRTGLGEFDSISARMFFLGAGFMLLETKAVVHMALIYGSTWIVNTVVFSALLVMVLCANLWVLRWKTGNLTPFYSALLVTLAINVVVPLNAFLGLPKSVQGIAAGVLLLSPTFCAGVIFARLFAQAPKPDAALAWNTAGAIAGGLTETLSMVVGFQWLLAIAGLIYATAWALGLRRSSSALPSPDHILRGNA
jgi:spermidine synthase